MQLFKGPLPSLQVKVTMLVAAGKDHWDDGQVALICDGPQVLFPIAVTPRLKA